MVGPTLTERLRAVEAGPPTQVCQHGYPVPWTRPQAEPPPDADLLETRAEVYVGMSIYSPEGRPRQHEEGEHAVRAFRNGRLGGLRADLPPLPPLMSNRAAPVAERWVGAHYEHRGFKVHGDGGR